MNVMHHAMAQPHKVIVVMDDKEVKTAIHDFWAVNGATLMKDTPGSWTKATALREYLEKQKGSKLYWDMMWEWISDGIKKVPLKVYRISSVSVDKWDEKTGAILSVVVDIIPKVKLGDYKNIKLQMPSFKAQPKEVEGQILLALNHSPLATTEQLHKVIEAGDTVEMSYSLTRVDNNEVLQTNVRDMVHLSSGAYAPQFVSAIIGESAPDKFNKTVIFPEDYIHESLRGVEVNLQVETTGVIKRTLPTEEAEAVREGMSLEDWRARFVMEIEKNKKETFEIKKRDFIRAEAEKILLATSEIDPIPDSMVESEAEALMQNLAKSKNMTVDEYAAEMKVSKESLFAELAYLAVRRLMVRFVVDAICEMEDFKADENKTEEFLIKYAAEAGESVEKIKTDVGEKDISFLVKSYMVDEFINQHVVLVEPSVS